MSDRPMSYQEALHELRQTHPAPPSFTDMEQRRRWRAEASLPRGHMRVATAATIVAALGYAVLTVRPVVDSFTGAQGYVAEWWRSSVATLLPAALLVWAIMLLRRPGVGPQMLARAVLWSNLVVGALISGNFMTTIDRSIGAGIAVACAIAILRMGSRGLDNAAPGDVFQPVRFRGHLLLALVMAFADTQTLLFSAVMQLRVGVAGWNLLGTIAYAGPITLAALVMVVAVWGLYRLRTWALILNLAANIAIAYFAIEGALGVAAPVAVALAATAGVQMFLPVPIFAAALGDRAAGHPLLSNYSDRLLRWSVILIATFSVCSAVVIHHARGWLTGPGVAFRRGLEEGSLHYQKIRHLEHADFSGRDLEGEDFANGRLQFSNFSATYGKASFSHADMHQTNLSNAHLSGSRFSHAGLVSADLQETTLDGSAFDSADLTDANLSGASLRFADLRRAIIDGANFRGADLTGATTTGSLPSGPNWEGATCPDGTTADKTSGCAGHEGTAIRESQYIGLFAPLQTQRDGRPADCPSLDTRPVYRHRYLFFMGDKFVHMGGGRFESVQATLVYEDTRAPVTFTYQHERCGRATFRRVQ